MLQISVTHVTAQHIVTHVTYFDYVFLYQKHWLRSMNVCSSAYTSLEQPQIHRIMACMSILLNNETLMLAFVPHVTLVLGCFKFKISANWHTIEKSA